MALSSSSCNQRVRSTSAPSSSLGLSHHHHHHHATLGVSAPAQAGCLHLALVPHAQPACSLHHASQRGDVRARAHAPPEYTEVKEKPKARLAVFVSGGGSNFKAIHAACLDGCINGEVVVSAGTVCGGGLSSSQPASHPSCLPSRPVCLCPILAAGCPLPHW